MEQVASLLQYPCRYHPMGCKEAFTLSKKAAHERDCPFLQLKCPFHGQCAFNGSLAEVVPHLSADHGVSPVPVQPNGLFFYREKNFYRRHLWALIFTWDSGQLFRLMVKHVHASSVGRSENCNLLVAHIQSVGPESTASKYAYQISLFDTETRRTGFEVEGLVTSTLKTVESQCSKDDNIFVTTFHQARHYTDPWANVNFIIRMKKLTDEKSTEKNNNKETSSNPVIVPMEQDEQQSVATESQLNVAAAEAASVDSASTTAPILVVASTSS